MIKAAIVGCGNIANQHAVAIEKTANAQLVATCDKEILMASQLAERFGAKPYTDVAVMIEEAKPDVVHVTTPPQSHFPLGKLCLEAGCHVYLEKPFTITAAETVELIALAEKKNLKITAGHNVQFNPETVEMRNLISQGYLGGPPVHMECIYCYNMSDPRYAKAMLGDPDHWVRKLPGKLAHNIISHGISKIAEFWPDEDPVILVNGFASPFLKSLGITDICDEIRVILSNNNGTTAYFTFSSQLSPPVHLFRIYGPKNGLVVDHGQRSVIKLDKNNTNPLYLNYVLPPVKTGLQYAANAWKNGWKTFRNKNHMDLGMVGLTGALYESIRNNTPPPIPYREIVLTSKIMEKVFEMVGVCGS